MAEPFFAIYSRRERFLMLILQVVKIEALRLCKREYLKC